MSEVFETPESDAQIAVKMSKRDAAKRRAEEIDNKVNAAANVTKVTKEAKPDPKQLSNAGIRAMKKVSKEEVKRLKKEADKKKKFGIVGTIDQQSLPVINFPTKMKVANKKYSKISNFLAGVKFTEGASAKALTYREAKTICATGFGPLVDDVTDVEFTLPGEGKLFTCENKFWHHGMKIPEPIEAQEEADQSVVDVVDAQIELEVASVDPESPVEDVAVVDSKVSLNKHESIKSVIARLRPGHKDDWTEDGLPDCNRLSDLMEDELPEDCGFSRRVSKEERDAAWGEWGDRTADEDDKNAFTVPATDQISDMLTQIKTQKGVKVLRQIASNMGIEKTPHTGDAVIALLIEKGVTAEHLKGI